jgi:hypothetical protein
MTAIYQTVIKPQEGAQSRFLESVADIAVYGGAAGGGKTYGLLLEPLRHIANPGFGGVIFRRTSPQITNEGGLWDTAEGVYPLLGARGLVGSLDWRFPSGASLGFRHLQHEATKYDWQGTQLAFLGFDELSHFSESQFFYLIGRMRSVCGVRPYCRATTNPDPGWVKRFLAPWVDKTFPDPADSGVLRWFVRVKGQLVWGRSREDLLEHHPGLQPKSVTFIRASVWDNPALLEKDPDYLGNLQALPDVERARLLDGDWDVRREGLVYPGFGACVVRPFELPEGRDVGGIDFGWNHPFCALAAVLDRDDVLWVHWERYQSWNTLPQHSAALPPHVEWSADPARPESIAELRIGGHDVYPCVHIGQRPILTGIDMVAERIRSRRLKISQECAELVREAGLYRYDTDTDREQPIDADNHACDSLRYLITMIDRGRAIHPDRPSLPEDDRRTLERVIRRMEERKKCSVKLVGEKRRAEEQAPIDDPDLPWWVRHDPDDEL